MVFRRRRKLFGTLAASGLSLALAVLALVAVNLVCASLAWQWDLTEAAEHSLSAPSVETVRTLPDPVAIRFYCSDDGPVPVPAAYRELNRTVRSLLLRYAAASDGRLKVEFLDPVRSPAAARSAAIDQVTPVLPEQGLWCGLAISRLSQTLQIPHLSPERAARLEYDLTRALVAVSGTRRAGIGILTPLRQVFGGTALPEGSVGAGRQAPPWQVLQALGADYPLYPLPATPALVQIPDEVGILLVIHPRQLPPACLYAIDQFLMRGGKAIVFLDPLSVVEGATAGAAGANSPVKTRVPGGSTLEPLLGHWGVGFRDDRILADLQFHTLASREGGRSGFVPTLVSIPREGMAANAPATAGLSRIQMVLGGAFDLARLRPNLKAEVLCHASNQSALVERYLAQELTENMAGSLNPEHREFPLAVGLSGAFLSSYGAPPPGVALPPGKAHLQMASGSPRVVLLADADMLYDLFVTEVGGASKGGLPPNDNIAFVQNLVDDLAGEKRLPLLRGRIRQERPLTVLNQILGKEEQVHRQELAQTEQILAAGRRRLAEFQALAASSLTPLSSQTLDEMAALQAELASAQKRHDELEWKLHTRYAAIEGRVFWFCLGLVPLLVALSGLCLAAWRWHRRRSA